MVSFRILGPIEAWHGDHRLTLGGPRQLALFAFLVLHANRAVPSDALNDALWGPARGADNRLQMGVARLRKALAPLNDGDRTLLRTVGGGYLLEVEPGQLDADVLAERVRNGLRALEAGEAARSAGLLSEALALWRGPPLAEVMFEDFAQGEIRRLEELRLAALETRIDADLRLGRHGQLIGELEAVLVEHPIRERVAAQLMLALYRSGRQAEALEVYQRTRVQLAQQLGLEPGPRLKELQAEILDQSPSLAESAEAGAVPPGSHSVDSRAQRSLRRVAVPLPSRLRPHGPSAFVDRRRERDVLARALDHPSSSGRKAAFVTGEPGIGKTRLASEVASHAHAAGTLVLGGRCDEGLGLPYQPFVEALEHLVEHAPTELLEAHVADYGDSLARLVPALTPRVFDKRGVLAPATESERYVLFRAIDGLLAAACGADGGLLVLEDLHWAELPTLQLLRQLLSSPRSSSLMLLCTCRVEELAEDNPLRELLADAHREPHMMRLELGGLGAEDVADLVRGVADDPCGTVDDQLVSRVEASTNGNPFFVTELVRSLVETGALGKEDGQWQLSGRVEPASSLPLSITDTLARRARRLGDEVGRCLRVASAIGDEFDLDLLSEVAGRHSAAVAVDRAIEGGVLVELRGQSARFRFAHVLMQEYLYGELGLARRTMLHTEIAEAMEARAEEGRWPIAELARHWVAAGDDGAGKALQYAILAGDEALDKLAPDEARRWYQICLELLSRQRSPRESELCDLLVRRGEAERQAGDRSFRETLLEAAEMAQRIGDKAALVRAALANSRGMQSETGVVDEARIATLDAALRVAGDGDSPARARLLAMQGAELMYSPDWDRRAGLSDEALAIARRLDDPDALSRVLSMRFVSLLVPETHVERLANSVEAVSAAERLSDPLARFYAYHWRGYACVEAGDIDTARSWVAREREIAERFRQPTTLWLTRADEANLAIIAGTLDVADRLAAAALEIGRRGEPDALACYAAQLTSIAFDAGRLAELTPMLEQAVQDNPGVPGFRATLALALSEGLRYDEAREILDRATASRFADLPHDVTWLAVMCIYAHVASSLGHTLACGELYGLLEPWADQLAFPAFGVWGPVGLYLGSLALVTGDLDAAERHLSSAARAATRAGAPIWERRAASQLTRVAE